MGGDFLDFFTLTDGVIGIYLGDVTGKGLPAALYAALAVGTLRGVHKTGTPPATVLSTVNRRVMLRGVSPRYAAVQYGCFRPARNIANRQRGNGGPADSFECAAAGSWNFAAFPQECFPETDYESQTVQLERDDSVNFSERWIQRIAELHGRLLWHGESARSMRVPAEKNTEEILHQMTEAVIRYSCDRPQQDDRTAAILRYLPN